jgi:hypothetical protein
LCRLKDQGILKYFESCCRLLFWVYHGVSTQRVGFPRPDYSTLEGAEPPHAACRWPMRGWKTMWHSSCASPLIRMMLAGGFNKSQHIPARFNYCTCKDWRWLQKISRKQTSLTWQASHLAILHIWWCNDVQWLKPSTQWHASDDSLKSGQTLLIWTFAHQSQARWVSSMAGHDRCENEWMVFDKPWETSRLYVGKHHEDQIGRMRSHLL